MGPTSTAQLTYPLAALVVALGHARPFPGPVPPGHASLRHVKFVDAETALTTREGTIAWVASHTTLLL